MQKVVENKFVLSNVAKEKRRVLNVCLSYYQERRHWLNNFFTVISIDDGFKRYGAHMANICSLMFLEYNWPHSYFILMRQWHDWIIGIAERRADTSTKRSSNDRWPCSSVIKISLLHPVSKLLKIFLNLNVEHF